MARPRFSEIDLWGKHARSVITIVKDALMLFAADDLCGLALETEMTRELYLRMLTARRNLKTRGSFVPEGLPTIDARNSPTPETAGTSAERKLPDIQWGYQDDLEADPRRSARVFHIECKRLGGSALNASYVEEGIRRFVTLKHRYGKDVRDGAMVGYLIEGDAADAVRGVNSASAACALPSLTFISAERGISTFLHDLDRPFPKSPFRLHHAWVITYRITSETADSAERSTIYDAESLRPVV